MTGMTGFFGKEKEICKLGFFLSPEKPSQPSRSGILIVTSQMLLAPVKSSDGNATMTGRTGAQS
jgi:hypothetical protein